MFSETTSSNPTGGKYPDELKRLREALASSDTVVIGAGAGLSTSAGFTYSGERFEKYFSDFGEKYGFRDMYSGGFFRYPSKEEFWAYWSRYIWVNRYMDAPKPVYDKLFGLVKDKNYFVITTNVDHCFQKAGFDRKRLFYTQGDYGLFQCSEPCRQRTYDNRDMIRSMILAQGFEIGEDSDLSVPEGTVPGTAVPSSLLPVCPVCGRPLTLNLRSDLKFVEDEGWHAAAERYEDFLRSRTGKTLFLELGVGYNTPVIIKYPFRSMTENDPDATYACVNYGEAVCPEGIASRSILLDGDIGEALDGLK